MGLFKKFRDAWFAPMSFDSLDDDFYDRLEESLILADVGMDVALDATEKLRRRAYDDRLLTADQVKGALREILAEKLEVGDSRLDLSTQPSVILVIGVNGVGKTTSIGKLAYQLKKQGKKVLLCAGDTFRAAAADQLEIWADRAGVDIVRQNEGADPGAVLFDALAAAKARRSDVVLVDTAGRLHNKANLMKELAKLRKIIDRELPGAAKETLLVLDATTGQNGLIQARQFKETAGLTGIVLTKLDGTAKGGIVIAIAQELQVPVKYVGLGEGKAGNSEAGHSNLGAGRCVMQDDVRLDAAVQDGSFARNPVFLEAIEHARRNHASLHLLAYLTHKSSHGCIDYPLAICEMAKKQGLEEVYFHIIFDGRSTEPGSAPALLAELEPYEVAELSRTVVAAPALRAAAAWG